MSTLRMPRLQCAALATTTKVPSSTLLPPLGGSVGSCQHSVHIRWTPARPLSALLFHSAVICSFLLATIPSDCCLWHLNALCVWLFLPLVPCSLEHQLMKPGILASFQPVVTTEDLSHLLQHPSLPFPAPTPRVWQSASQNIILSFSCSAGSGDS